MEINGVVSTSWLPARDVTGTGLIAVTSRVVCSDHGLYVDVWNIIMSISGRVYSISLPIIHW